jgi:hypothetical protein
MSEWHLNADQSDQEPKLAYIPLVRRPPGHGPAAPGRGPALGRDLTNNSGHTSPERRSRVEFPADPAEKIDPTSH